MKLDIAKVTFSDASLVDDFGRVFFYEGRVFRAIYIESADTCANLISTDFFKKLVSDGLVAKTYVTNFELDGFSLVLEHEFIHPSKPHQWSFSMYKDAALLLLRLNQICNSNGYELKDSHPFNIFFKDNRPVFIDIGSISKKQPSVEWIAYEQFLDAFYIQLLIWASSDFFLARKLIEDGNHPVQRTVPMSRILDSKFVQPYSKDIFQFTGFYKKKAFLNVSGEHHKALSRLVKILNRISSFGTSSKGPFSYVKKFRNIEYIQNRIENLNKPRTKSFWATYHDFYKKDQAIQVSLRFDRIIELVRSHAPSIRSAIDLAGNQGVFCHLLSQRLNLERIILTDYDSNAIDIAYSTFSNAQANVAPYLFNFMAPLRKEEVLNFQSDIVFALAITHHLILTQRYSLYSVLRMISSYTRQYAVIEFMPLGLWGGNGSLEKGVPSWYTIDWFRKGFKEFFDLKVEDQLEENRIVLIGKKVTKIN